jgi:hypothetical protein
MVLLRQNDNILYKIIEVKNNKRINKLWYFIKRPA